MDRDHRIAELEREVDELSERLDLTRVGLGIVLGMLLDREPRPMPPTAAGQFLEHGAVTRRKPKPEFTDERAIEILSRAGYSRDELEDVVLLRRTCVKLAQQAAVAASRRPRFRQAAMGAAGPVNRPEGTPARPNGSTVESLQ